MLKKKVIEQIPCGSFPHSISLNKNKKYMVISNMQSDNITLIDCKNKESALNIKVDSYPTKAIFDPNGEYILVCESNIGISTNGTLSVIDAKSLKILGRIKLGNSPVDLYTENNYCYISNFGDGTISIVDIVKLKEIKRIKIGGMPRGIVKSGRYIFVGDNYNNLLVQIDIVKENKKVISIGGEPTGMTIS